MKTNQHTQGNLQIPFNYVAKRMADMIWNLPVEIPGWGEIARVYGYTRKECEANAQHIIKAVNMHDDLTTKLGLLVETMTHMLPHVVPHQQKTVRDFVASCKDAVEKAKS